MRTNRPITRTPAVSFDLGQTLVELDEQLLLTQAMRCGLWLSTELVSSEQDHAWQAYNAAKASGKTGFDAWAAFVRDLLLRSGCCAKDTRMPLVAEQREAFIRFLWSEQPDNNLWRKPIPGMFELVRTLVHRGTKVGILTNSEGRARELVDSLGLGEHVRVVIDSGVEGIEKPDPRIFALLLERLQCVATELTHVGDSFEADVLGALRAGIKPIWFIPTLPSAPPNGVLWCRNARELAAALTAA